MIHRNNAAQTQKTKIYQVPALEQGKRRKYRFNPMRLCKNIVALIIAFGITLAVVYATVLAWDKEYENAPKSTDVWGHFTPASEWVPYTAKAYAAEAEHTPQPVLAQISEPEVIEEEEQPMYTEEELDLLARLIHGEADGESYHGKLAVGTVVMNRMISGNTGRYGGPTMKGVILKHKQFQGAGTKSWWAAKLDDKCISAAQEVLDGYRSFGSHILYFSNPKHSTVHGFYEPVLVIGNHTFGQEN